MGFRLSDLGFGIQRMRRKADLSGSGFRVYILGFRVYILGFRVGGLRFTVCTASQLCHEHCPKVSVLIIRFCSRQTIIALRYYY